MHDQPGVRQWAEGVREVQTCGMQPVIYQAHAHRDSHADVDVKVREMAESRQGLQHTAVVVCLSTDDG